MSRLRRRLVDRPSTLSPASTMPSTVLVVALLSMSSRGRLGPQYSAHGYYHQAATAPLSLSRRPLAASSPSARLYSSPAFTSFPRATAVARGPQRRRFRADTGGGSLFASPEEVSAFMSSTLLLDDEEDLVDDVVESDETSDASSSSTVDRAPCFDGACDSSPDDDCDEQPTPAGEETAGVGSDGEAILRLGTMTGPTVWSEFGRLSQEYDVANLGQGFPDWLPPDFAVQSLVDAALDSGRSPHQYTRTAGHPALVKQLARRYGKHLKRKIDPMNEVAVTVGASQALYLSLQTLVKPGDEVILFEPFFDLYVNQIKLAGGTPVYVPLTFVPYDESDDEPSTSGGEWILEPSKLTEAMTSKTRAILLNSPHNPTGKVFTRSEMLSVADAVVQSGPRCVVISDEVYKYIVHSPPPEEDDHPTSLCLGHVHFASLPDMWDRTITVSSAGKTFSATGWQVGWCVGPDRLISPLHQLLPYVQFCASTVIQEALARTLPKADEPYLGYASYYEYLGAKYKRKRDLLADALRSAGFAVQDYDRTPGGGFFIFARIGSELRDSIPADRILASNPAAPGGVARVDWALCQWMAEERGVLCIPSSPFFSPKRAMEGASDEFVRVAFCKTDETIERAAAALGRLRRGEVIEVKANGEDPVNEHGV